MAQTAIELGLVLFAVFGGLVSLRWLCAAPTPRGRAGRVVFFAGAFLVSFALRMHVAAGRVSPLPYLDQWKADVGEILQPVGRGESLSVAQLVHNHAEHRILPTRVASIALLQLNHEWDNRPLVVLSLAAQALALAWWATFAFVSLGGWRGGVIVALTLLVAALSCDWENIVSGFQSQFHFTVLGSLVAFAVLPPARAGSAASLAALATLALLLVTLGSGAMAAAAIVGALIFGALAERRLERGALVTLLASLAIFGLGLLTRPDFHGHDFLHATSADEWWRGFLAYGAWPLAPHAWALLLLWAPSAGLAWRCLRRREIDPFARATLALALWVLLQAAALAWSRFGFASFVSSRYTGLLVFAGLANAGALACLVAPGKPRRPAPLFVAVAFVAWSAVVAGHWLRLSRAADVAFDEFRAQTIRHENRVIEYLRTADPRVITAVDFPAIPYPVHEELLQWLRDPGIRAALPASARRAILRHDQPNAADKINAGWITALAKALLQLGAWLAAPGALLLAWGGVRLRRGAGAG